VVLGQTLQDLETWRRRRELAGDDRAGSWARATARRAQRAFLLEHWRLFTVFATVAVVLALAVCAFEPTAFLKGLVLGAALTAVPGLVWSLTLQVTGTAPKMMGDQAEQWTAQEFRKLQRRGCRLVNHFLLGREDVDHVLIGPGGVYAVETKWSASWDTDFAAGRQHDAVRQVQRGARSMSLWEPLRKRGVHVQPVVVLWGGDVRSWAEDRRFRTLDGVPVVTGPALGDWTKSLSPGALDPDAVDAVWADIDLHARRRDDHDRSTGPVPVSMAAYVTRGCAALVSACLGFLMIGQALKWTGSVPAAAALGAATLVPAAALVRLRRARTATWGWVAASGWIVGVGLPTVALVVAEALTTLS
jgi:hypothetical protein